MKNIYGLSSKPAIKSPTHQGYSSYITQKQLQQLNKYKKEQESDRDSFASGYSGKGRRMKLRSDYYLPQLIRRDERNSF